MVAVIINHFNKDLLPSGYLGVDIFFVISGYVITSSLANRKSLNFADFVAGFYERRIKRLVPALVGFVLITSALISLVNPAPGPALDPGWKSLFGISNISQYRSSTDYFAPSAELNPFTHTWPLGVEEQFYLLFPFLIWLTGFGEQSKSTEERYSLLQDGNAHFPGTQKHLARQLNVSISTLRSQCSFRACCQIIDMAADHADMPPNSTLGATCSASNSSSQAAAD